MALFGRKKKKDEDYDDEYEEEEELEEKTKKPLRRKFRNEEFKDLSPENRKKRKEPARPWGKKERFLTLFLILATAGVSGYLALASREYKLPNIPRFKVSSFSIPSFFGEETIILEGENEELMKANKIKSEFTRVTEKLSGVYGLYIVRLDNGYSYGVNEEEVFIPASLNKLPAIAGMYMKVEEGEFNLNDPYILKNSDKLTGSGILRNEPAGKRLTYRELVKFMGKDSDNTAFNISRRIIAGNGWASWVEEFTKDLGMEKSQLVGDEQKVTPKDIGIFFRKLYEREIVKSPEYLNEIYGHMTNTSFEDWLSDGIPSKVRFAHKYGREIHVVNDAGIVFADKPYVIVVLSKGVVEKEADKVIPELSQIIYNLETKD